MVAWLQLAQRVRDLEIRLRALQVSPDRDGASLARAREDYLDALRQMSRFAGLALARELEGEE